MKLLITELRLPPDGDTDRLKKLAARKLGVHSDNLKNFKIVRESIDARKKPDICRVYSVMAEIPYGGRYRKGSGVREVVDQPEEPIIPGEQKMDGRPVIVGSGPAGIFAALVLAQAGYRPLVLERGYNVEARTAAVDAYWNKGELNPECNIQFGEGGAGTFSDGKLTTRINDRRCDSVLRQYYEAGAPEEILYKAKPHIGSDVLRLVVANMRQRLIESGGEIRFGAKMTSILCRNGRVTGVTVNGDEDIKAGVVVVAIGHSARDTFSSLLHSGVQMVQKPFSIGVRIEHPQGMINAAQYGAADTISLLGAADYQLSCRTGNGRTAYTFCMCPGGVVVAAASEPDTIVTNGMSYFARDLENANSAFVVSVGPGDFGSSHALAGIEFQRIWERKAFQLGGSCAAAPVQRLADFMEGRVSVSLGSSVGFRGSAGSYGSIGLGGSEDYGSLTGFEGSAGYESVKPSYTGNVNAADLNLCLPEYVLHSMKEAVTLFDRKLSGFAMGDAVLTGVETRTSSPVRITRGDTLEAVDMRGLYPAGEGAGYAGGIVSAAVDGMRVAEQIIRTYMQP